MKIPTCKHCTKPVIGDARIQPNGDFFHASCIKPAERERTGYKHRCPKCKTTGKANHDTQTSWEYVPSGPDGPSCAWDGCRGCHGCRTGTSRTRVPVHVKCNLCDGRGYTKTPAKVQTKTVVMGYTLT